MKAKILMVENDPDDRFLVDEMFRSEDFQADVDFVYGRELAGYIEDTPQRPHLILLSVNAQPYDANSLIRLLRETEGYRSIPIVVLSESDLPSEVEKTYRTGANSYIKKPDNYADTIFKIKTFIHYWFRTVELPEAQ